MVCTAAALSTAYGWVDGCTSSLITNPRALNVWWDSSVRSCLLTQGGLVSYSACAGAYTVASYAGAYTSAYASTYCAIAYASEDAFAFATVEIAFAGPYVGHRRARV